MHKWIYGANSVQGKGHARLQMPCQDFASVQCQNNVLIAVLADGAGTAKHAREAAQYAVETMIKLLTTMGFGDKTDVSDHVGTSAQLEDAFSTVNDALFKKAKALHVSAASFATTLMAVIATPTHMIAGQVGDGFCVIQKEGVDHIDLLFAGRKGEYVNETDLLPSTDPKIHIKCVPEVVRFVALSSDGLTPVAIVSKTARPFAGFFQPFIDFLQTRPSNVKVEEALKDFLTSAPLRERVEDDVSMVIGGWV